MNRANFTSPSYLRRIKAAVLRAVTKANRKGQPRRMATETVYNRHDKPSLLIIARAGLGFEVFGGHDCDEDVTSLVKEALREMHATAALPLIEVEELELIEVPFYCLRTGAPLHAVAHYSVGA
ncbi:hypothetical protein GOD54_23460 [Sinorhizobium medicae]|nr:hypothetical protein [Sinorhizobium medicae]